MIISSKKYACETCIKGHRSSACKHTDRPLFEIKKKGRPVTQCEHCRELRKTKQVHVKCLCESKDDPSSSSSYQHGVLLHSPSLIYSQLMDKIIFYALHCSAPKLGFDSAAFPNGLPQALEASVAFQPFAEGTSSDSDHGAVRHGHKCKSGDPCTCVSSRARTRAREQNLDQQHQPLQNHAGPGPSRDPMGRPSSSHNPLRAPAVLTRIAELRTILPRPPPHDPNSLFGGPIHDPSTGYPHGHSNRHHNSTKPYNLAAYGMAYQQHVAHPSSYPAPGPSNPAFSSFDEQNYTRQTPLMGPLDWAPQAENAAFGEFPSLCGCGDDCSCPGCLHHNRSTVPSSSAYMSCRNPETCATCLDCTIMSFPPSAVLPADTALSIYTNSQQIQNSDTTIDDWLRQQMPASFSPDMGPSSSSPPTFNQAGFSLQDPTNSFQQQAFSFSEQQQQSNMINGNYNHYGPSGVPSMIPYGSPHPPPNTGYPNPSSSSSAAARTHRSHGSSVDESVIDPRLLPPMGSQFLRIPNSHRSRSPSTSSQSSQQGSADGHTGSAGGGIPPYRPSGRMQGYPGSSTGGPGGGGGGGRSAAPQLNIRPNAHREAAAGGSAGSSASISPSPGSSGSSSTRSPFPPSSSSPESSTSTSSQYDPSLAGLHLY